MTAPCTVWIGGSYLAACGYTPPPPRVKPPPLTKPAAQPKDTSTQLRSRALRYVEQNPGATTEAIALALGVTMNNVQWTLQKARRAKQVHRIKGSAPRINAPGVHPQNRWYPGPDTGVLR